MKARVRRRGVDQARITALMKEMEGVSTKVGLPKEASPSSGSQSSMAGVARIAYYLHRGVTLKNGTVKSWTFMDKVWSKEKRNISKLLLYEYKKLIQGDGGSPKQAIGRIGEYLTLKTVREIQSTRSPALEKSTIRRKRSSKPLIDHGQLVGSITHIEG